MSEATALTLSSDGPTLRLVASGEWIAREAQRLEELTRAVGTRTKGSARVVMDITGVTRLDTLGAKLLGEAWEAVSSEGGKVDLVAADPSQRALIEEVAARSHRPPAPPPHGNPVVESLVDVGKVMAGVGRDIYGVTAFLGELVVAAGFVATGVHRVRWAAIVTQSERMVFRGVPIIVLITFLVGAIVAQQTIFQLERFGATLFVVDLLGILMLREVGLLLASIMIAGRSGSAITAELGSMKMREEIDAMRVMGLSPMEILIIPRILALVVGMPLLSFLASMAGLFGGGLVAWGYGGITPTVFFERLQNAIGMNTFLVGILKAPAMGLMIGVIGCIEGMKVKGSAESLGQQTTASVVKAIFTVIVVDGLFAIFFAAINY